nr:hypothetical protein CFP56_33718 [Quercus suber]
MRFQFDLLNRWSALRPTCKHVSREPSTRYWMRAALGSLDCKTAKQESACIKPILGPAVKPMQERFEWRQHKVTLMAGFRAKNNKLGRRARCIKVKRVCNIRINDAGAPSFDRNASHTALSMHFLYLLPSACLPTRDKVMRRSRGRYVREEGGLICHVFLSVSSWFVRFAVVFVDVIVVVLGAADLPDMDYFWRCREHSLVLGSHTRQVMKWGPCVVMRAIQIRWGQSAQQDAHVGDMSDDRSGQG